MALTENIENGDSVDLFVQLIRQGYKLLSKGNSLAAVDAFKQSLALKETWESFHGLGLALYDMQKNQAAVDAFKQSLALKETWQASQGLGLALYDMQQNQAAADAFKQSLALKETWKSFHGLGSTLYKMQQYQPTVDAFKQSLALKETWQSFQSLGWALYKLQQNQAAVDAFKQSLALKETWQSFQGLGSALFNLKQHQSAVDAFKQSLALKETWQSYHVLGWALLKMQQYQAAVDAFKQSLALKENEGSRKGLEVALFRMSAVNLFPHLKIDPFLGEKHKVTVTRNLIENIADNLSKIQFAFHPSYLSEIDDDSEFKSWMNLVHIHIPKCAGTNFEKPLTELPIVLSQASNNGEQTRHSDSKYKNYLWQGNLQGKNNHDSFILKAFKGKEMDNIQGSFLANHFAKHRIYCQKLAERGIYARKICLVRDPVQRLYSHVRHLGRESYSRKDLINQCMKEVSNLMDRYIYDYDLFEGQNEPPYCDPTDYGNCKSIDFIDITDELLISRIKSSFLSATLMPNIVQYNRLNEDKHKVVRRDTLLEKDFRDIHQELILRGCLNRDNLIDLEYLKNRTKERLVFPRIVYTGVELHPITVIFPNSASNPKWVLTKDFISDPLNIIKF